MTVIHLTPRRGTTTAVTQDEARLQLRQALGFKTEGLNPLNTPRRKENATK